MMPRLPENREEEELVRNAIRLAGELLLLEVCSNCGGHIFETDPKISKMEGHTIWSHLEDTKCDDPTAKDEL